MKFVPFAAIVLLVSGLAAPTAADNGPGVSLMTAIAGGQSRSVDLSFRARIGPFELARGTMRASFSRDGYSADATYRTSGIAASFNNDAGGGSTRGTIENGQLRPRTFINQETSGKRRRIAATFRGSDVDVAVTPAWGNMGFPPATIAQKLEAVDPLTGLIELSLLTSRDAGRACGGNVKIFDGKRRYDIRTSFVRMTDVSTPAYRGRAAYCRGSYTEVAGFGQPKPGQTRQPIPLELWLADIGGMGVSVPVRISGSKGGFTANLYADRAVVR
jgi:Protein of unknown function (DUF3108)